MKGIIEIQEKAVKFYLKSAVSFSSVLKSAWKTTALFLFLFDFFKANHLFCCEIHCFFVFIHESRYGR